MHFAFCDFLFVGTTKICTTIVGPGGQSNSAEFFDIFVAKEDFKFSSSHFVASDGFRERLHGHNYSCGIRLKGEVRVECAL